ncbi:MAG: ribbon-helix-helix domain-containing protein [Candidatus Thermoplasmatota archaeon]|jgi:CopG family nickel-responsive transcriptional regulator|nr:ribbon-helix-helix domain-containing protein [Candidatus Thermoplasmatota archaeon]MCL5785879.1 ribbon-helix-helix domain-containing protein [Candidatus Thermoplasmatota archaeon]
MPVPYRITIRVAQDTLRKLEKLVESYDYESVSDIIRKAIDEFVDRNYREKPKKVDVMIPRKVLDTLAEDLSSRSSVSLDDLIRAVLREYTSRQLDKEAQRLTSSESDDIEGLDE